jgi:hypothetical protein
MIHIKQTNDKEHLDEILKQLKANDHYCPCSLTKTQDDKCMCKSFRDQIERKEPGECACGRYILTITED